jgi:hypothetical protein
VPSRSFALCNLIGPPSLQNFVRLFPSIYNFGWMSHPTTQTVTIYSPHPIPLLWDSATIQQAHTELPEDGTSDAPKHVGVRKCANTLTFSMYLLVFNSPYFYCFEKESEEETLREICISSICAASKILVHLYMGNIIPPYDTMYFDTRIPEVKCAVLQQP